MTPAGMSGMRKGEDALKRAGGWGTIMEHLRISSIQAHMNRILFRDLPAVSEVERQLGLRARDRLLDDDIEELPHLIDDASWELFGITQRDTFYWALPEQVRMKYGRTEWEARFEILGHYTRDPNAHWDAFDLDLRCEEGGRLHCLELFGRQLVCALYGLHPQAVLAFVDRKAAEAA
jgi:hypothetical protein